MTGYSLGKRSEASLVGVHPDLAKVVRRAISITGVDFSVIEGVRTYRRQCELYGCGRLPTELVKAGVPAGLSKPHDKVVTWTLVSNHFKQHDDYGHAVDMVPYPIDWKNSARFDLMADAMFTAAKELGIQIRWGADWDGDGKSRERGETDSPHFELLKSAYKK